MSNLKSLQLVDPTKFYELRYGDNVVIYVKSIGIGKHTKLAVSFTEIPRDGKTYFDDFIKIFEQLVSKIEFNGKEISCAYFINELVESVDGLRQIMEDVLGVNTLTDDESKNSSSLSEQSTADPVKETSVEKPAVVESAPVSTIPTQTEQ